MGSKVAQYGTMLAEVGLNIGRRSVTSISLEESAELEELDRTRLI